MLFAIVMVISWGESLMPSDLPCFLLYPATPLCPLRGPQQETQGQRGQATIWGLCQLTATVLAPAGSPKLPTSWQRALSISTTQRDPPPTTALADTCTLSRQEMLDVGQTQSAPGPEAGDRAPGKIWGKTGFWVAVHSVGGWDG